MAETLSQKIRRWILEGVPIPEIIRRRNAHRRAKYEAHREEARKKEATRLDRMTPVEKCWRIGRQIFWTPPKSSERVIWYRIHEQRQDGGWFVHGTTLPSTAREAVLYGDGLCRIEAKYSQTGFATPGLGPVLKWHPEDGRFLVNRVRYYVSEKIGQNRPTGVERWRRALAGLGVIEAKVGWAGRGLVYPLNPPMTAREAQSYADRGWNRWVPVARAIRRLEEGR